ncbi:50S ribosomal protein L15 [Patescibacteria group bacterium]|nr:50S ribosomal protein L15 [Patescibacteria group bacterium]
MGLYNLKASPGSKKKKRRVGRGNASGRGNYSGRGMKGQRSRSGGKNKLALRGVKTYLQRIPKAKGFKTLKPEMEVVNIKLLNEKFSANDEVTPKKLLNKGLVKSTRFGVKILGQGRLTKKLTVKANRFSKTAKDAIIKAGGQAEIIRKNKKKESNKTKE